MEFAAELERSTPSLMKRLRFPAAALALVLITSILILALSFRSFRSGPAAPIAEKSIAVLPFENFSDDKENSYFAAGIQDDVLTSLAQIHELKVISRTSVMAYQKPGGRNMREISQALGVANVLEGSVRRTGNRVLVNVQLIDARNDRHIWAERYDRAVADSIGLQGELATQIASALKAKLAPEEKARLDVRPTTNSEAYVLYLTGLGLEGTSIDRRKLRSRRNSSTCKRPRLIRGSPWLTRELPFSIAGSPGDDPTRKASARAQAEEALRLSPTLGEAHMALGLCLYWGEKNYDAALKEFEVAAATSPNNAEIHNTLLGSIAGRDAGANRLPASNAPSPSILATAASHSTPPTIISLCVTGLPRLPVTIARWRSAPDSVVPKIGLSYLEVFRNGNPAAGQKHSGKYSSRC